MTQTTTTGYIIPTGTKAIWRNDGPDLPITIAGLLDLIDGLPWYSTEEFTGGTPANEIILDLDDQLEWLANQGAKFALPKGRTKKEFDKGWQSTPHSFKAALAHASRGGNVGILTGIHSDNIIAIDRDVNYPETIAMLGDLGKTAKIERDNAPGRGKFLYRIKGALPPTTVWKENPSDKHPACECLAKGRHALGPMSEFDGGHYVLVDMHYGIKELTTAEIEHVWRLITGETFDKSQRKAAKAGESDEHRDKIRAAWPTMKIFEHHGFANNGTEQDRGETRVLGNGGLLINDNGQWYIHADEIGGDEFDAWAYCTESRIIERGDKEQFKRIKAAMATAAGLPVNGHPAATATQPATIEADEAAAIADEAARNLRGRLDENSRKNDAKRLQTIQVIGEWCRGWGAQLHALTPEQLEPVKVALLDIGQSQEWIDKALPKWLESAYLRSLPLSEQIERDLKSWGYSFWLNDMDDSVWIADKRMDDPERAILRMKARDVGYGGKGNSRTLGALEDSWLAIAAKNRRHPVREWLNAQTWDGTNHIAQLSAFFTGKPDEAGNEPTVKYDDGTKRTVFHAFLRRWLVGAVAKQMGDESAVRSNFVLTLTGGQDDGKSHFANWICPLQDYFVEGSISPENKDHMLLRTKSFVWEVKELGATTKKADVEALKGFITGVVTAERQAYGHFETRKISVASYVGTVNLDGGGFLSDVTGNRRFAVVDLESIDWAYSEKVNLAQVWAQAVALWQADPKAYRFSPEEVKVRDNAAENHMEVDIFADMLVRIFEIDPSKTGIDWRMSSSDILEKLRTYAGLSRGNDRVQGRDLSKSLQKNWGIKSRRSNGLTYYDGLKLRDLSTASAAVAGMMAGL